jgi:alkylhydroperoxidase family enzyme
MTTRPANGPLPDRDDSAAACNARSAALLAEVAATFAGTAPNIYRMLAANPAVLECLVRLEHLFERDGMLSTGEQAIVALIVADHADCQYCRAVFAKEVEAAGISLHVRRGIQQGKLPRGRRLAAITHATRRILASHGRLGRAELGALERRGITYAELLELVAIIATYKLATYANNLSAPNPEFR